MTIRPNPGFDDGGGHWGGGGRTPWWDYPTPMGVPKQQHVPYGACYTNRSAKNGEVFQEPSSCDIFWPWTEHKIQTEK